MEKSRVYGGKCGELLATLDQELSSWKMLQTSFDWAAPMLLEVLPKSGMTASGRLFPLVSLERHTLESVGLVLPTPRAYGGTFIENPQKRAKRKEKHGPIPDSLGNSILEKVKNGQIQLPTPNAADSNHTPLSQSRQSGRHQKCLNTVMGKMVLDGQIMGITMDENIGKQLRIHHHFVEWMMGFPIGWLD